MGLIERNSLITNISPPFDHLLATQFVDEFLSMERRFIQRDWEPTELDAGQFAEITSRILYHLDSGTLNYTKGVGECIDYFNNNAVTHNLTNLPFNVARKEIIHISKVLQAIYKFRSDRGAVHISATYEPNHMDSKYLIESVRWCMNEMLRIFWNGDREEVAKTIRELLQFDVPCIGVFGDILIVQRTDLRPDEEILILLHYAGENGFSRRELGIHSLSSAPLVTTSIKKLSAPDKRQVIQLKNGNYRLTDLGSRRIRLELADKLLLSI
ncbi:hypothetical protein [Pedobacter agri]|uniref:Uncharacterized protein n=1 Tax=Pedobacter agri TaxID=454586 RepID=A0A9X3DHQ7_9SPHI|nr:hypothetical protein [Pedobacter agri]MCX3267316.1 hypothetical protein [Pedobacter agri]